MGEKRIYNASGRQVCVIIWVNSELILIISRLHFLKIIILLVCPSVWYLATLNKLSVDESDLSSPVVLLCLRIRTNLSKRVCVIPSFKDTDWLKHALLPQQWTVSISISSKKHWIMRVYS